MACWYRSTRGKTISNSAFSGIAWTWYRFGLRRSALGGLLERDHLERHAEDLGDLLGELSVLAHLVVAPPQPAAHDLLAQQLGHERPQPDDVGDRVAVPSLGQHAHRHDAPDVPAGRMERPFQPRGELLEPLGIDRTVPASRAASPACPRCRGVNRIQATSSDLAPSVSVSCTTFESTRIVRTWPSALRSSGMSAGGTPAGATPSASHSYSILASWVFLATRMKTGGRRSSPSAAHSSRVLSQSSPINWIGGLAHLSTASGFGLAAPPAPLAGGELLHDPLPDVEVSCAVLPGRVGDRELRDLDQARLDRVRQPELADDPGEDPVRLGARARQVVRGGGEVDAEVDAAQPVDAVQPLDPDRRLLGELLDRLLVERLVLLQEIGAGLADPVGVVGLVVEHQDVALAADLAAQDPLDPARVALDVPGLLDDDLGLGGPVVFDDPRRVLRDGELERLRGHVLATAAGRRLLADLDRGPDRLGAPRFWTFAPACIPFSSNSCQFFTSTRPPLSSGIRWGGTRSRVR